MAGFLKRLPFPLKLFAGIAVVLLVIALLGSVSLKGAVGFVAVVLWMLVIVSLLYITGPLAFLRTVPVIGGIVGAVTRPVQTMGPAGQRIDARGEDKEPDGKERQRLLAGAMQSLEQLQGLDPVKAQLNHDLTAVIEREAQRGAIRYGTDAPVVLLVLYGPSGSGKSSVAEQIAPLFCGYGALKRPLAVTVHRGDLFQGYGGGTERVAEFVERANGGVLILEDADWLVETDKFGASVGIDIGRELYRHCNGRSAEQPALIVATLSGDAGHRLQRSAEHRAAWLNKVSDHWFEFPVLEPPILLDLLHRALVDRGLTLQPEAEAAAASYTRDLKREAGAQFDNALAMRRVADQLARLSAADNRSHITVEDIGALRG